MVVFQFRRMAFLQHPKETDNYIESYKSIGRERSLMERFQNEDYILRTYNEDFEKRLNLYRQKKRTEKQKISSSNGVVVQ